MATSAYISSLKDVQADERMERFFEDQLKEIFSAEKLSLTVLSKMQNAATFPQVRHILQNITTLLVKQVERLEEAFNVLTIKAETKKSFEMEELINKADAIIKNTQSNTISRDFGLILVARKMEHYKISTYGALAEMAQLLNHDRIYGLLGKSHNEGIGIDSVLLDIAQNDLLNNN